MVAQDQSGALMVDQDQSSALMVDQDQSSALMVEQDRSSALMVDQDQSENPGSQETGTQLDLSSATPVRLSINTAKNSFQEDY